MTDFLPTSRLERQVARIVEHAEAGRDAAVWADLRKLLRNVSKEEVALAVLQITEDGCLSREQALEALVAIHDIHAQNEVILAMIGEALEKARDIDMLNSPPPAHPLFETVVNELSHLVAKSQESERTVDLLSGLGTAARTLARQRDNLIETSHRRLLEMEPQSSRRHYNFGLFLKTRGRFREGMIANQRAAELREEVSEGVSWNLGICATGASEGATALEVWKRLGHRIEMGRFGLPQGGYAQCKVRLAQRPLAERDAESDDPGLEETIWIERLSPCHGVIRSVLYQKLGVDFGDVILFDGAAITFHTYGERQVPVFPHLATLVRSGYRMFDFAGTQESKGQIAEAGLDLERDAVVYAHTESLQQICAGCWRDSDIDHSHDEAEQKHVVRGRIAAPPDLQAHELLRQLDLAIAKREPCRIYVPDLCEAAGLAERATVERRRFDMIVAT